ncbi:MAG: hypothetical protein AB3N23_01895 [Paracoccaceae bacterium]
MRDRGHIKATKVMNQAVGPPKDEPDRLLETYGHHLDDDDLIEPQQKELLMALWQIMRSFAELGFSVKSGDKLYEGADHSFDDVVRYITLETTAPETVAPQNPRTKQEQP